MAGRKDSDTTEQLTHTGPTTSMKPSGILSSHHLEALPTLSLTPLPFSSVNHAGKDALL